MEPVATSGLVSLVVAVSGHKDLYPEDSGEITRRICEVLEDQSRRYPHTPILVLTGMAEGADRLAIAAVNRLQEQGNERISWMPILPMPRDLFLEDFRTTESRKAFEELTAQRTLVELPLHPGNSFEQVEVADSEARTQQYADLADFLVNTSQILIAIWNGHETGLSGGTSELVKRKLGRFSREEPLAHRDESFIRSEENYGLGANPFGVGPVYHIKAKRMSQPDRSAEIDENTEVPENTKLSDFEEIYLLLDEYNWDIRRNFHRAAEAEEGRRRLTGNHHVSNCTPAMLWTAAVYSWSDLLADRYQRINLIVWRCVFLFLAVAGIGLHLLESVRPAKFDFQFVVTALYYVGTMGALGLWTWEDGWALFTMRYLRAQWTGTSKNMPKAAPLPRRGLKFRRKHEDYRALAEALRVQYFWLAAGMQQMVCESYLDKHAGNMVWVRDATSESLLYRFERAAEQVGSDQLSLSLGGTWIKEQLMYFSNREVKEERRHKWIAQWGVILAAPTFVVPLIRLLICWHYGGLSEAHDTLADMVPSLSMLFAVMGWNYSDLQGFEQHALQSRQMRQFYTRADSKLRQMHEELALIEIRHPFDEARIIEKKQEIRRFLWKVGRDALVENGDWLAMHRGRDLKIDQGSGS